MGNQSQEVVVTDIHMRFWSIVFFMVKFSIASIPAMIILMIIMGAFYAVFAGTVLGITGSLADIMDLL